MRYILLDRITALDPPERATGVKCVSLAEDIFVDHFPGIPIMPGALLLESMAQLGGTLLEAALRQQGRTELGALLTMVDRAKFRSPARPGDRVEVEARTAHLREDGGVIEGRASVEGKVLAQAELTFAFVPVASEKLAASRREYLGILLRGAAD